VNCHDYDGETPLVIAVKVNSPAIISILLMKDVQVLVGPMEKTAVAHASRLGHYECLKELLEHIKNTSTHCSVKFVFVNNNCLM